MSKENQFSEKLDEIIEELRRDGLSEATIGVVRMVSNLNRSFLADESILQWLKEKALIYRIDKGRMNSTDLS